MIYISDDEYRQMNANHESSEREKLETRVKKLEVRVKKLEKALQNKEKAMSEDDTWFHPFKD